jgi:hypothetical protein
LAVAFDNYLGIVSQDNGAPRLCAGFN